MLIDVSKYVYRFTLAALLAVILVGMASTDRVIAVPQQDSDITRTELRSFDKFLDSHPAIAKQLRKNPSLVNSEDFREKHPELREFLNNHPGVREELKENPRAFMRRERRFERSGGDITRTELRNFDKFLDSHPAIAKELKKDPSLVNKEEFRENHPELREFLNNHPGVREELKENPRAFMRRERRFERSGGDITRTELKNFDKFLDKHPEIAKELQKDPTLIHKDEFVENHPELREFLKNHPGVREELKEHPRTFMKKERRYDKHEKEGRRKGR